MSLEEDVRETTYRSPDATCRVRVRGRFVSVMSEVDRFWSKVQVGPDCWLWLDGLNRYGYGRFTPAGGGRVMAHRYAYELTVGPIPEGLTLDHLCERTDCVRPDHMDPCTNSENLRRRHARARIRNGDTR